VAPKTPESNDRALLERVTALVGHELRGPLASALMHLATARREVEDLPLAGNASVALSSVGSALQRLDRLVARVIELEEQGRAIVRPAMVDLAAVVNHTVADALRVEPSARSSVTVDECAPMVGWWDDMAVEEVVRNLLSNAIRFGEGQPIRIAVAPAKGGARLTVQDNGRGIPALERSRIFKRGVHAPARKGGGLGLGLWIVRELVRAHGGRTMVQSKPGQGATFTITLRERPPERPAQAATGGTKVARAIPSANRLLVFARDVLRAKTFGALLAAALDEVRAVAGYEHVWFLVANTNELDELRLIDFSGGHRETVWEVAPVLKVKGDRFLEELVSSDGPVVIADARTDARTNKEIVNKLLNRTLINIPLRLVEQRLGVFGMGTFGDEGCRVPSQRELDYLVGMAGQIAVAAGRLQFLELLNPTDEHRSQSGG
jgi:anti-sigma regulatory factor (Ser/Thr protein kinase)